MIQNYHVFQNPRGDEMENRFFNPGENIKLLGYEIKPKRIYNSAACKFPIRIHVTPIDCNRFAYGKPGGGGIGFAVTSNNFLTINFSKEPKIKGPNNKIKIVEHCMKIAQSLFNTDDNFIVDLQYDPIIKEHSGFGSSAITMASILSCFNQLYGNPLDNNSLRRLIGNNFVEQSENVLSLGLETGVGPQVLLHGGIAVLADDLRVIYSGNFLPNHHVALVDSMGQRPPFDGPERDSELFDAFSQDASFRYIKSYMILMDLIPALYNNDTISIAKFLWPIQFGGCHNSMLSDYIDLGSEIISSMAFFKQNHIHLVGMSSVGPTIYAIHENEEHLISICEKLGKPYILSKVHNEKLEIELLNEDSQ